MLAYSAFNIEGLRQRIRAGVADGIETLLIWKERFKLRWRWSFMGFELTRIGMGKPEAPGVEHEAFGPR